MSASLRIGQLWRGFERLFQGILGASVRGGVIVLYGSVLALASVYAEPPSPLDQARQLTDEASRLLRAGRYQEAIPLVEDALRWRETDLGPMHPLVAESLNNLAGLYRAQGRYVNANSFYQRVLAIREQALGPTHPDVASTLNDLARLHQDQGRHAEAEPLLQRALVIREQALGPAHMHLAQILNNLAEVYWAQGRYAEANTLYQRAFALWEQAGGPNHLQAAHSLGKVATLLAQHHQLDRAHDLFERARQIYLAVSQANVDLEEEAACGVLRQQTEMLQTYTALLAATARKAGGDSTPSSALAAFVVAEQARGGAVQLALARAGARTATAEPATATLARQVEDLRRRQRALWRQLSPTYRTFAAGWDASRMACLQLALQQVSGELRQATQRLHEAFPRYAELAAGTYRGASGAGTATPSRGIDRLVHAPRPRACLAGAAGPGAGVPGCAHRQGGPDADGVTGAW